MSHRVRDHTYVPQCLPCGEGHAVQQNQSHSRIAVLLDVCVREQQATSGDDNCKRVGDCNKGHPARSQRSKMR